MIQRFDYSLPPNMLSALLIGAALPLFLAALSRVPRLSGRNALQFLVAAVLVIATWASLVAVRSASVPINAADICVSLMGMGAELLVYLEVWSLISRGYTLGLLLTLSRAEGVLDEHELARRYRGGEGLAWIMQHRLSALVRTGLVRQRNDVVQLSGVMGLSVVRVYKVSMGILGLRQIQR